MRRRENLTTQRAALTQYLLHHDDETDEGGASPHDTLLVVGAGSSNNAAITSPLPSRIDWSAMASALDPLRGGKLHHAPRGLHKRQQLESLYVLLAFLLPSAASPHTRIVDFGCGSGNSSLALAALFPFCHFTLLDVKPTAIALAEQRAREAGLTNVSFFVGDVDAWEAPFDIGLGLHCCGSLTDRVQLQCLARQAAYVLAPCCLGKIANTPAAVIYPRSAWMRRGLRLAAAAAAVAMGGVEGDGTSTAGAAAAAGVNENDVEEGNGGKEEEQHDEEEEGDGEEGEEGNEGEEEDTAAVCTAITTSTTTAATESTTQESNNTNDHAPPAAAAAAATAAPSPFFLPSYAILASAADHHSHHHAEDRITKHLLELDRQQAALEQAPGYSVYITHLTPLSCSEKNIVLVGLPPGWEGGRRGEEEEGAAGDVVSARVFLQRLGQAAAEKKEEEKGRTETEREEATAAEEREGGEQQLERVSHRAPRAERRRQRGHQAPLVPESAAFSSSASPAARAARCSYLIRNRRPCQHPALLPPLPPPPPATAATASSAALARFVGEEEEEEECSLTSRSTIEEKTSVNASVGFFCRLHHPEAMARARVLASRGKGKGVESPKSRVESKSN